MCSGTETFWGQLAKVFLHARCLSCHPMNSVKALKETNNYNTAKNPTVTFCVIKAVWAKDDVNRRQVQKRWAVQTPCKSNHLHAIQSICCTVLLCLLQTHRQIFAVGKCDLCTQFCSNDSRQCSATSKLKNVSIPGNWTATLTNYVIICAQFASYTM